MNKRIRDQGKLNIKCAQVGVATNLGLKKQKVDDSTSASETGNPVSTETKQRLDAVISHLEAVGSTDFVGALRASLSNPTTRLMVADTGTTGQSEMSNELFISPHDLILVDHKNIPVRMEVGRDLFLLGCSEHLGGNVKGHVWVDAKSCRNHLDVNGTAHFDFPHGTPLVCFVGHTTHANVKSNVSLALYQSTVKGKVEVVGEGPHRVQLLAGSVVEGDIVNAST